MMGMTRLSSTWSPSAAQASSTASMSAMSAMEHPAFRSGRKTCWRSLVKMSADSAMKCTPQNTMNSAELFDAAIFESPNESPRASAKAMTSSCW